MRRISIIGLGRSGEAAALLAKNDGFSVLVSDSSNGDDVRRRAEDLSRQGIFVELGEHSKKILDAEIIVVSPGVPLDIEILKEAEKSKIPVISEIEFAYRHEQGKVIAITGSNGKSTTATLVARIFESAGYTTFLAGNIGNPYSSSVMKTSPSSITVLELSSFQLEAMDSFHPYVAAILNLSPDHLDRYSSPDDYFAAKFHIFDNQSADDYAVLWADQKELKSLSERIFAQTIFFSSSSEVKYGADVRNNTIYRSGEEILNVEKLGIPGPHNLNNALAAVAMTIPFDVSAKILGRTLREFKGIEHRLERFFEHRGIVFVNDSKATNPDSLKYALLSFERPIVLIAGGYDKGADFSGLRDIFSKRVKAAVFTGDTGERMAAQLCDVVDFCAVIWEFEKGVRRAVSLAAEGDVLLLSPGCASFDQFKNFEHRGRFFKEIVQKIIAERDSDKTAKIPATRGN
ncbi:UDP-N-acetylmuramoyl-L-alanine--D-glutamate ligase [bacterium]|nr:MAG: UDP-N-acetylmuramoyl-L-alanine--D-glutamate ligase [bacterium]